MNELNKRVNQAEYARVNLARRRVEHLRIYAMMSIFLVILRKIVF